MQLTKENTAFGGSHCPVKYSEAFHTFSAFETNVKNNVNLNLRVSATRLDQV